MLMSGKGVFSVEKKLGDAKVTLNPNATEFVPVALRSPAVGFTAAEESSKYGPSAASTLGKGILDRSESSVSHTSDDESQQYWSHQLPEDITPDFKAMGVDDAQGISNLSLSNLSLTDVNEGLRYVTSTGSGFMLKEGQALSPHTVTQSSYSEMRGYPVSHNAYSPKSFHPSLAKPWDQQIIGNKQLLMREGLDCDNPGNGHSFLHNMSNEQLLVDNKDLGPIEFLASQFPGHAAENLAEVYFANAGDLNLTIEMLSQLQLQFDGDANRTSHIRTLSAPSRTATDFPALSPRDPQSNQAKFVSDGLHQNGSPYLSSEQQGSLLFRSNSSIPSRGHTDFASVVRKMPSQDSAIWRYNRIGSPTANIGSSRSSQVLASSHNTGQGRVVSSDRLLIRELTHASPVWLETGEAVANIYSEMREEARDHARFCNAYFEQARQAYLIGNKALAKELSFKGQLHNMQMKAVHGKAQEAIYRLRNSDIQRSGMERMIDLHGLHVTEAIHVLKHELAVTKNAARSMDRCFLVYVCVGTGHHRRGPRSPVRLPIAIQRYLLEEGFDFSEPQPGLLRVVIYCEGNR